MRITFLGTGTSTGVPVIGCDCEVCRSADPRDKRLRASVLWEIGDVKLVVDAGPDFRMQMIGADVHVIDGILITHKHYDHVGGLDDIRGFNYSQHISIDVYAEKMHADQIRYNLPYVFAVKDKYPGVPEVRLHEITEEPFEIRGVRITPLRVIHGKMPIFGYKIGNWAYITDASELPEATMKKLEGIDTLIINALRHEPHMSHFTIEQSLEIVAKVRPRRTYFVHMSHQYPLHAEADKMLPEGVFTAYDGLVIEE